jgi:hypothetical protein
MLAFCVTFQDLCFDTYPNTQVFCYIMTLVNLDGVANFEILKNCTAEIVQLGSKLCC